MTREIRLVFTADTHLGFDDPARPRVERRRRGDDFFANYERVLSYAVNTRPDVFVHGGDFFTRSRPPASVVDRAYAGLIRVAEAGIPVVIAPGNHDRSRLPRSLLLHHPLIHVFDRARTVVLESEAGQVAIAGFPFAWGDVRGAFRAILGETGWDAAAGMPRLLCVHHAFEGATVGPSNYVFRRTKDVIRVADLPPGLTAVLSGHIHRHQVIAPPGRPPVLYPGSTERTSFAERDDAKGFLDLSFAPDENGRWQVSRSVFVELPARPMVDIDLDGVEPGRLEAFLAGRAATLDRDAVVRLKGDETTAARLGGLLGAGVLRALFPPTMNVQLAVAFHGARSR